MSGAATATRNAYDAIKSDPDKTAAQDQTVITTRGLQHAAGIFTDAADEARAALAALTHLQAGGEGHQDTHT